MRTQWYVGAALLAVVAAVLVVVWQDRPLRAADDPNAPAVTLSGPYVHKNLAVYLIHGSDRIKEKEFLTLAEALEQKKAVVAETGEVERLTVENLSTVPIYVHAGAIVKGGKQDRMVKDDYLVPPKTKISVYTFCVESGRWRARGSEKATEFSSNTNTVATKELKLAARSSQQQGEVWKEVGNAQTKLSSNVGGDVRSKDSASSLQLTLEDQKVKDSTEEYRKALADIVKDKKDVVGYAFAINGKINSTDVYGAKALFLKLWPQLLEATAVEAVANLQKDQKYTAPDKDAVRTFMEDSRKAKPTEREVTKDSVLLLRDSKKSVNLTTVDKSQPQAAPVRENVISKE